MSTLEFDSASEGDSNFEGESESEVDSDSKDGLNLKMTLTQKRSLTLKVTLILMVDLALKVIQPLKVVLPMKVELLKVDLLKVTLYSSRGHKIRQIPRIFVDFELLHDTEVDSEGGIIQSVMMAGFEPVSINKALKKKVQVNAMKEELEEIEINKT